MHDDGFMHLGAALGRAAPTLPRREPLSLHLSAHAAKNTDRAGRRRALPRLHAPTPVRRARSSSGSASARTAPGSLGAEGDKGPRFSLTPLYPARRRVAASHASHRRHEPRVAGLRAGGARRRGAARLAAGGRRPRRGQQAAARVRRVWRLLLAEERQPRHVLCAVRAEPPCVRACRGLARASPPPPPAARDTHAARRPPTPVRPPTPAHPARRRRPGERGHRVVQRRHGHVRPEGHGPRVAGLQ